MTGPAEAWFEDWAKVWRTGGLPEGVEADVRRSADRRTRAMRLWLGAEVVVTAATLGAVGTVVTARGGVISLGWAVAAAIHTGVVWGFTIWNRRGTWLPLGESTVEYLRLTRLRVEGRRRAAVFTLWLVGFEVAALGGLAAARWPTPGGPRAWLSAAAVTSAAIGWAIWSRRRARAALSRLARLEAQL